MNKKSEVLLFSHYAIPKMTGTCTVCQKYLTTILGVHRATPARAIQKLKKLNVITKFSSKTVEICDLETLKQLAEL